MTILLQRFGSAWRHAQLDPRTGQLRRVPFWRSLLRRQRRTQGWYAEPGGTRMALFTDHADLWLLVGEHRFVVTPETMSVLADADDTRTLRVSGRNGSVAEVSYRRPTPWPPPGDDPTPFVEEEQFDFGLFVHNVIGDAARQERLRNQR